MRAGLDTGVVCALYVLLCGGGGGFGVILFLFILFLGWWCVCGVCGSSVRLAHGRVWHWLQVTVAVLYVNVYVAGFKCECMASM